MTKTYPAKWQDGIYAPNVDGLVGFIKSTLVDPLDTTTRLAFADFLTENMPYSTVAPTLVENLKDPRWVWGVGRLYDSEDNNKALNSAALYLWEMVKPSESIPARGFSLAKIRCDLVPRCADCQAFVPPGKLRQDYLSPTASGWMCRRCRILRYFDCQAEKIV